MNCKQVQFCQKYLQRKVIKKSKHHIIVYSKKKAYHVHHHIEIMNVHHVFKEQKQQMILKYSYKNNAFLNMQVVYHQILFFNILIILTFKNPS